MNLYQFPYEPELARTRASKDFSRVGFSLLALNLVLTVVAYAMQIALLIVYRGDTVALSAAWWWNWILSLVPLYAVATPVMLLVLRDLPKAPHNEICLERGEVRDKPRFTVGTFLLLAVIALGLMYVGNFIGVTLLGILSELTGANYENDLGSLLDSSPEWMNVVGTVIFAPIGEEFLFRKLIIDRTRRWGDLISIAVSSVIFALIHGNFFQFFYTLFIGIILAYLYTRTGKLRWCVAMHAVVNFFGAIFMPWLAGLVPDETVTDPTPLEYTVGQLASLAYSYLVLGLMAAAVALICILYRRVRLSRGVYPLTLRESVSAALRNPGMISTLVLLVINLLSSLVTPILNTMG